MVVDAVPYDRHVGGGPGAVLRPDVARGAVVDLVAAVAGQGVLTVVVHGRVPDVPQVRLRRVGDIHAVAAVPHEPGARHHRRGRPCAGHPIVLAVAEGTVRDGRRGVEQRQAVGPVAHDRAGEPARSAQVAQAAPRSRGRAVARGQKQARLGGRAGDGQAAMDVQAGQVDRHPGGDGECRPAADIEHTAGWVDPAVQREALLHPRVVAAAQVRGAAAAHADPLHGVARVHVAALHAAHIGREGPQWVAPVGQELAPLDGPGHAAPFQPQAAPTIPTEDRVGDGDGRRPRHPHPVVFAALDRGALEG